MSTVRPIPLLIAAVAAVSCTHSPDSADATPRRYAYPRVEVYDTVYRRVDVGPVSAEVNSSATVTSQRPGWLDISYPRYGTTLYLSAVETSDIDDAVANRRQRISLNLGGAKAVSHDFTAGDFECVVVESVDAGNTPVQLLAASPGGIIVSGTATLQGPSTPADSIRPIVDALTDDAIRLLMSLQ